MIYLTNGRLPIKTDHGMDIHSIDLLACKSKRNRILLWTSRRRHHHRRWLKPYILIRSQYNRGDQVRGQIIYTNYANIIVLFQYFRAICCFNLTDCFALNVLMYVRHIEITEKMYTQRTPPHNNSYEKNIKIDTLQFDGVFGVVALFFLYISSFTHSFGSVLLVVGGTVFPLFLFRCCCCWWFVVLSVSRLAKAMVK